MASRGTRVSVAESLPAARLVPVGTWLGIGLGTCVAVLVTLIDPSAGRIIGIPLLLAGIVAMIDQYTGHIANRHSVGLLAVTVISIAVGIARGSGSWSDSLVGIAIWTVPFFAMAFVGSAGGGDFKLAATLGAITGWHTIATALWSLLAGLLACTIAGLVSARRAGTLRAPVRLGLPLYLGSVCALSIAL
jgi:Flp pilus assembly protein protease CpaA